MCTYQVWHCFQIDLRWHVLDIHIAPQQILSWFGLEIPCISRIIWAWIWKQNIIDGIIILKTGDVRVIFPPASAVEGVKSVLFVCVSVCPSVLFPPVLAIEGIKSVLVCYECISLSVIQHCDAWTQNLVWWLTLITGFPMLSRNQIPWFPMTFASFSHEQQATTMTNFNIDKTLQRPVIIYGWGGSESKVGGGASKILWCSKSGHRKKIKKPWVGLEKIPYQKISPLARHFLTTSITLSHELKTCTMCTFILQ